jgi:hypothetical protein
MLVYLLENEKSNPDSSTYSNMDEMADQEIGKLVRISFVPDVYRIHLTRITNEHKSIVTCQLCVLVLQHVLPKWWLWWPAIFATFHAHVAINQQSIPTTRIEAIFSSAWSIAAQCFAESSQPTSYATCSVQRSCDSETPFLEPGLGGELQTGDSEPAADHSDSTTTDSDPIATHERATEAAAPGVFEGPISAETGQARPRAATECERAILLSISTSSASTASSVSTAISADVTTTGEPVSAIITTAAVVNPSAFHSATIPKLATATSDDSFAFAGQIAVTSATG